MSRGTRVRFFPRPFEQYSPAKVERMRAKAVADSNRLVVEVVIRRDEQIGPSPYHCRWCGHPVAAFGTVLDASLAEPMPWARKQCEGMSCESDAVLAADGTVIPRESGTFVRRTR